MSGKSDVVDRALKFLENIGRDNPALRNESGKAWLAAKREMAEQDRSGKALRGADTAWTREPVEIPVELLSRMRGAQDEVRGPGDPKFDALFDTVTKDGWNPDPISIAINHRGEPFIYEGNTRSAVAKAVGIDTVPGQIHWMNGAEMEDGNWTPEAISEYLSNRPNKGGGGEIVEQALKLVAGGLKEAGPTAAERAAKNLELMDTAKRLGVDTNDLGALQETKSLIGFHKNMMGDIKERAQKLQEIQRELQEGGAFPLEVGSRYTTSHSREKGLPPHTITGYFVDPKDPYNRYGYRVRREFGNGDYEEGINLIRDPKLEQMHGPEKWKMLQESIQPFTGLRTVKEYGGAVREGYAGKGRVIGDVVDKALDVIRAYHVSPHDFDKFEWSPKTRGTGEGHQAYGDGLYFAESPLVSGRGGEYWRNFMDSSQKKIGPWDAMAANTLMRNGWDRDKAIADLRAQQSQFSLHSKDPDEHVARHHRNMADSSRLAADLLEAGYHVGPHTYEVNIKANPSDLLDWDNPYSPDDLERFAAKFDSTNPGMRRAIEDYGYQREKRGDIGPDGQDLMLNIFAKGPGPSWGTSSRDLLEAGVPGIRYYDGNSRNKAYIGEWKGDDGGIARMMFPTEHSANRAVQQRSKGWEGSVRPNPDATRNYVIFDDKLIDIRDKYAYGGDVSPDADRDIESAMMIAGAI